MYLFNKPTVISYTNKSGDKIYPVVVDIKQGRRDSETISFMTADTNTGVLSVAFVEGEDNYTIQDATVVCSIQRPDGTELGIPCVKVADNIVEAPLGINGTSQAGNYTFDFKIARVGSKTIGVPLLNYVVNESISNDEVVTSEDRLPILNELISTVTNVTHESKISTGKCNQATTNAITATSNMITTTNEANQVLATVKNAIASGTVDLELKQLRTSSDGTVYATANDRIRAIEQQPYILFEEVIG